MEKCRIIKHHIPRIRVIIDPVGGAIQQGGQGGTPATSIPTLSEWVQYLLALVLLVVGSRVDWLKRIKVKAKKLS